MSAEAENRPDNGGNAAFVNTVHVDINELVNDGDTDLEGIRREDGSRLVVDDQTRCPSFRPIPNHRIVNP